MSRVPLRSETKAILVPSGDQAGSVLLAFDSVRFLLAEPSAFKRQISLLPLRLDGYRSCGTSAKRASATPLSTPITRHGRTSLRMFGSPHRSCGEKSCRFPLVFASH